jgi:hypothetical protein
MNRFGKLFTTLFIVLASPRQKEPLPAVVFAAYDPIATDWTPLASQFTPMAIDVKPPP